MTEDKKVKEQARKIVERSLPNMEASSIFLSLLSKDLLSDPVPVVQLGMAMLLDKPIYLLALSGTKLPENIVRVAKGIEYYDDNDTESLREASVRLLNKAKEDLK